MAEDLTFDEFKELVFSWVEAFREHVREGSAADRLYHFLKSGCTEDECKRWLALHLWDFDDKEREMLTMLLAADALHRAAKEAGAEDAPHRGVKKR